MKIGDRVETEDGPGEIVAIENPDGRVVRYGVILDEESWKQRPWVPHYFQHELTKIVKTENVKP